ncbi:WW domain-binding protein 4 [Cataglyphis hispanica]|uniref:WW domain-binding protein 4 n=1 Tax=Cataglyphis hispanica TaxID=1086592 RepID=UPI0021806BAE|nr:WW domain-binding protein 4 [Cataglyphis hispanica]XP_050450586.1 WW domain-binding protein 4 [Cataglyphis hispanica]
MADYWKSQGRKFCDFCKCWIADNKPSIDFHEGGKKHKENVSKRLKEIYKNSAKQAKQNKKFENDLKKMENAAMAAYMKDVENNTRDMTVQNIIKEKVNKIETRETPQNFNRIPLAAPETIPRFRSNTEQFSPKVDPCDPILSKTAPSFPRVQGSENRTPGKSKANKTKGKGRKAQEDDRPTAPVRKLWYEALSPEGYTYYWHIETNESIWEPPEEGYMTLAEQEEEAKEEALQKKLMEQLDREEAIKKADILEEQRANLEREKMREHMTHPARNDDIKDDNENTGIKKEAAKEERPYWRDYSVPERPQPYGSWQVVETNKKKPVDLQLPQKQKQIQLPIFEKTEPPPPQRTFKEKTVTQININDSDDEDASTTFKKRKIGNKNVRKRTTDD